MDRIEADLHAADGLPGHAAQWAVVVAGDIDDLDSAPGHGHDFSQHRRMVGMPPVSAGQCLHVDDVADQIEFFAAQLAQEIEQVAGLAVGRAQMHVGDEGAAADDVRHDEGSGGYRDLSVGPSGHRRMANGLQWCCGKSRRVRDRLPQPSMRSTCATTGTIARSHSVYWAAEGCSPSSATKSACRRDIAVMSTQRAPARAVSSRAMAL